MNTISDKAIAVYVKLRNICFVNLVTKTEKFVASVKGDLK